jgi:hypothetical protein
MTDTRKFSMLRGLKPVKFNQEPIPTGTTNRQEQNREDTQQKFERYNSHRVASRRAVATEVDKQTININTIDGANLYPSIENMFFNKKRSMAPSSFLETFNHYEPKSTETPWFPTTVHENVLQDRFTRDTRTEKRTNFKEV